MATGCNVQETMFKLSYLMLQKEFPCYMEAWGGTCPSVPELATPLFPAGKKAGLQISVDFLPNPTRTCGYG
jgi:hypothetical protein